MTRSLARLSVALALAVLLCLAAPAAAYDFPPITDAEKELGEYPGASAVILFEDADFHFRDLVTEASSRMEVTTRIESLLTEEGKSEGEVRFPTGVGNRLGQVEPTAVA